MQFKLPMMRFTLLALIAGSLFATTVVAGTFNRTKTMVLKYGWGTTSMQEFDDFDSQYPGALPTAVLTFYTDGTFDAIDNASGATGGGIYDKRGRNLEITIVPDGPLGTVQYVGKKVGRGLFEGEILVDGCVWGHWRGTF